MTLTLLECPDLVGVPITAEVCTSDGLFIHTVDGLALFDDHHRLQEVAVCLLGQGGKEHYRVLDRLCDLQMRASREALWLEGESTSTRRSLEELTAPQPSERRQPSIAQIYGTYGRRP